jgi:hypothetical protein
VHPLRVGKPQAVFEFALVEPTVGTVEALSVVVAAAELVGKAMKRWVTTFRVYLYRIRTHMGNKKMMYLFVLFTQIVRSQEHYTQSSTTNDWDITSDIRRDLIEGTFMVKQHKPRNYQLHCIGSQSP